MDKITEIVILNIFAFFRAFLWTENKHNLKYCSVVNMHEDEFEFIIHHSIRNIRWFFSIIPNSFKSTINGQKLLKDVIFRHFYIF